MPNVKKIILFIEKSRAYGRGLIEGIFSYSRQHGPWSFYTGEDKNFIQLPDLKDWKADGAVVRELSNMQKVINLDIPAVICVDVTKGISPYPFLSTDQQSIAQLAAQYFMDLKFRNYAYSGYSDLWWARERESCFSQLLKSKGFQVHVHQQHPAKGKRTWSLLQEKMITWLKSLPKPVAIMACNDDHARYIIEACKIAELYVPEQVAVLGVDNDTMVCDLSQPPISSVSLDTRTAGYKVAELLDKLMNGEAMNNQLITVKATHIVSRQSTNILAVKDNVVVEAVRFIRQNANMPIQVDDIANAACVSRSTLERRFKNELGHSILKEIRCIRAQHIAQLLIETNMTVAEIADTLNYISYEHIGRYFRREMGVSPQAYRKKYKV